MSGTYAQFHRWAQQSRTRLKILRCASTSGGSIACVIVAGASVTPWFAKTPVTMGLRYMALPGLHTVLMVWRIFVFFCNVDQKMQAGAGKISITTITIVVVVVVVVAQQQLT